MADEPPEKRVSPEEIQALFNENGYLERIEDGEFEESLKRNGHPAPKRSGHPHCTRSQILAYRDEEGNKVAVVHRYRKPDGTIGGSGRPDPKYLFHEGVRYKARGR